MPNVIPETNWLDMRETLDMHDQNIEWADTSPLVDTVDVSDDSGLWRCLVDQRFVSHADHCLRVLDQLIPARSFAAMASEISVLVELGDDSGKRIVTIAHFPYDPRSDWPQATVMIEAELYGGPVPPAFGADHPLPMLVWSLNDGDFRSQLKDELDDPVIWNLNPTRLLKTTYLLLGNSFANLDAYQTLTALKNVMHQGDEVILGVLFGSIDGLTCSDRDMLKSVSSSLEAFERWSTSSKLRVELKVAPQGSVSLARTRSIVVTVVSDDEEVIVGRSHRYDLGELESFVCNFGFELVSFWQSAVDPLYAYSIFRRL